MDLLNRSRPKVRRVLAHLIDALARTVLVFAVAVVVGAALWWYFGVYDTAKGKCERGDMDACLVWQFQRP